MLKMPRTILGINVRLVSIMKRFPELYNPDHDLANDEAHSMVAWDTISFYLDTPVDVLKKKWEKLLSSHGERCRSWKTGKTYASLPRESYYDIFHSVLDTSDEDSPRGGKDCSSVSSAQTSSIISDEGGSTRSSSTSTMVPEVSDVYFSRMDSSGKKSPTKLMKTRKSTSTRILRSHNQNNNRSTSSAGASESVFCRTKDLHNDKENDVDHEWENSIPKNVPIAFENSKNHDKKFSRFKESQSNEPIRTFFESMALTVAKFPQHMQAVTKTKICNIVVEAELELSSPVT